MNNWKNINKREIIENVLGLVFVIAILFFVFTYLDIENIQHEVDKWGIWAPLVFILAKASTIIFAPLSGSPLYPISGAVFGFTEGVIIMLLGDILGGCVAFFLSRRFGRKIVDRLAGKDNQIIEKALGMISSVKGFFVARLCFAALPEVPCYAAGLTKMKFLPFLLIHIAVDIIPVVILVGSGSLFAFADNSFAQIAILTLGMFMAGIGGVVFYLLSQRAVK
jgi:uncharacterized membrane protein YdjX (TVP38/TMEM64 family)